MDNQTQYLQFDNKSNILTLNNKSVVISGKIFYHSMGSKETIGVNLDIVSARLLDEYEVEINSFLEKQCDLKKPKVKLFTRDESGYYSNSSNSCWIKVEFKSLLLDSKTRAKVALKKHQRGKFQIIFKDYKVIYEEVEGKETLKYKSIPLVLYKAHIDIEEEVKEVSFDDVEDLL